jgi:hypothetical protein
MELDFCNEGIKLVLGMLADIIEPPFGNLSKESDADFGKLFAGLYLQGQIIPFKFTAKARSVGIHVANDNLLGFAKQMFAVQNNALNAPRRVKAFAGRHMPWQSEYRFKT